MFRAAIGSLMTSWLLRLVLLRLVCLAACPPACLPGRLAAGFLACLAFWFAGCMLGCLCFLRLVVCGARLACYSRTCGGEAGSCANLRGP